jgi:thioesterase domain-containing protein
MRPDELRQYLHDHIPLSRAMDADVVWAEDDGVMLQAPLAPNINHRDTVFGGSASALAILAAWSLLHVRLRKEDIPSRIVIQRNSMEYIEPILGVFTARAQLTEPDTWPQFTAMLARKRKARIAVASVLECRGQLVGRFEGDFVALHLAEQ